MNRFFTRLMAVALCLIMVLGAVACSSGTKAETPATTTAATTASDAVDADTVIARIGDKYTVTYGELEEYYNYYLELASYYGMSAPSTDAEIEEYQDMLLADYVSNMKQYYYADQYGIELTDEAKAAAQAEADEEMAYYMEDFIAQAQDEGLTDEAAIQARAEELFGEDLIAYGINKTASEYADYVYSQIADEKRLELLKEYFYAQASVTEEDVQNYYNELVTAQKESFGEDVLSYADSVDTYEKYGGDPVVYTPAGYYRVKVLKLVPSGELDSTYTEKKNQMTAYEAEYGVLALADAEANAKRLKEIETYYAALKMETEGMYEAYTKDVLAQAEEITGKLSEGASFDEMLTTYGADADYKDYALIGEKGKLLYADGGDGWDAEIREAAMTLKPGTYSEVIQIGDAFYIVYMVGEEPMGEGSLTDVYDAIKEQALTAAQTQCYDDAVAAWEADNSMVTLYENLYRGIGKN